MNDHERNDMEHLEENLERLLSRVEPTLSMPREDKEKILAALHRRSTPRFTGKGKKMLASKPVNWLAAAAVVLLIVLVVVWPGVLQHDLAWADVAEHLTGARTFSGWIVTETAAPEGTSYTVSILRQKDPSMNRADFYAPVNEEPLPPYGGQFVPEHIVRTRITISERGSSTSVSIVPAERLFSRTTVTFSGTELLSRADMPRDMVSQALDRLKELASDRTKQIGTRKIDGIRCAGFETDLSELIQDRDGSPPKGVVRVWADAGSAVPMEIEVEGRDPMGRKSIMRLTGLRWNLPLDDNLFKPAVPAGWRLEEKKVLKVGFEKRSLAPGVTFTATARNGRTVLTERDIARVVSGTATWETPDARPRRVLSMELTPEAGDRLAEFTAAHQGEPIEIDFNGESRYQITIGGIIRRHMIIDVNGTGKTLEQFENEYLSD